MLKECLRKQNHIKRKQTELQCREINLRRPPLDGKIITFAHAPCALIASEAAWTSLHIPSVPIHAVLSNPPFRDLNIVSISNKTNQCYMI